MRVSIPIVVLLAMFTVVGLWWHGTRDKDFMTPPDEARLAEVRTAVEASVPQSEQPENAVIIPPEPPPPAPPPPPPEPPKPPMEPGDFSRPPEIHEYRNQAVKGVPYLMELAGFLESQGQFQRALLAWERVLDSGEPDSEQSKTARVAVQRLRPTLPEWNTDPKKASTIILHAGAARKTAKAVKPFLEDTAKHLEKISSGLLKVKVEVAEGRDIKSKNAPVPVAMWLTGANKKSRSTDVLSFTVQSPETLAREVDATTFQIACGFLGHKAAESPPSDLTEGGGSPRNAISSHLTRLFWQELGSHLNHPAE